MQRLIETKHTDSIVDMIMERVRKVENECTNIIATQDEIKDSFVFHKIVRSRKAKTLKRSIFKHEEQGNEFDDDLKVETLTIYVSNEHDAILVDCSKFWKLDLFLDEKFRDSNDRYMEIYAEDLESAFDFVSEFEGLTTDVLDATNIEEFIEGLFFRYSELKYVYRR